MPGIGKILYEIVTGHEVADFPECPSWVFDETEEAAEFKALNEIILQAADPIAENRHQDGDELLEALDSICVLEDDESTAAPARSELGRVVYAGLAVAIVAVVMVYVKQIDAALAEVDKPVKERVMTGRD